MWDIGTGQESVRGKGLGRSAKTCLSPWKKHGGIDGTSEDRNEVILLGSQSGRDRGSALHVLYLKPWHVKTAKSPPDWASDDTVSQRTVCKENKKAVIMTTGLMTTGLKTKNIV